MFLVGGFQLFGFIPTTFQNKVKKQNNSQRLHHFVPEQRPSLPEFRRLPAQLHHLQMNVGSMAHQELGNGELHAV